MTISQFSPKSPSRYITDRQIFFLFSGEILGSAAAALEIMGQREEAVEMARRALESGYSATQLRRLRDLDDLLEDPALADLL